MDLYFLDGYRFYLISINFHKITSHLFYHNIHSKQKRTLSAYKVPFCLLSVLMKCYPQDIFTSLYGKPPPIIAYLIKQSLIVLWSSHYYLSQGREIKNATRNINVIIQKTITSKLMPRKLLTKELMALWLRSSPYHHLVMTLMAKLTSQLRASSGLPPKFPMTTLIYSTDYLIFYYFSTNIFFVQHHLWIKIPLIIGFRKSISSKP